MGFTLDPLSVGRLQGVHSDLVRVVNDCAFHWGRAFSFAVSEGLRSEAQQKLNVERGVSDTLNSRHLDGHAVDLVCLLPGKILSWAWPLYDELAEEMREASIRTGTPLIWGGVWDMELATIVGHMDEEMAAYVLRARAAGKRGFVDGPHFQLPFAEYPSETS